MFSPFSRFRRFRVFAFSRFRAWRFRVFAFSRFRVPPAAPPRPGHRFRVHRIKLLVEFLSGTARSSKKRDAGMLTGNAKASSAIRSHALEQLQAAFKKLCWNNGGLCHSNKFGFLKHIWRHICSVGTWKYLT